MTFLITPSTLGCSDVVRVFPTQEVVLTQAQAVSCMATVGCAIWVRVLRGLRPKSEQWPANKKVGQHMNRWRDKSSFPHNRVFGRCFLLYNRAVCQRSSKRKPPRRFAGWKPQCRPSAMETRWCDKKQHRDKIKDRTWVKKKKTTSCVCVTV